MSELGRVIKDKNKVEKMRKARRREEMRKLQAQTAFKARLYDELRHIDVILDEDTVDAVIITVPDTMQSAFSTALYSDELANYDIKQVENTPNQFYVRKKFISF